ncbi:hypothetical protein PNIG_a3337 [Pseudoalteromonas nigrifaciens]|uniref:Orphan protein n=3 Tax=Pseudoalteromonas TaxID=53246 RepID=Q3IFC1_PSET1|nr:hypothetical protein PTRA_a3156 [Pseudoalteromonas translucida KMM 520]ASM55240.1 hypothetical protein PNIG_a3337 [Pseudoalteromonas nigrifaciens]CAI87671.1 putative orphan protein [Pseudoalteromonas translucida]SJN46683.1 putative orphan protein [Pseudoalteromonas sp. JB197]SUC50956.1 Uncharacterised protein [Pseudoalteromonas nigrifaciens]
MLLTLKVIAAELFIILLCTYLPKKDPDVSRFVRNNSHLPN